ncbi:YdcF family protein [Glaciimonas soli]|uniref:YdcF family protein n=1 Tax=Glaciimonas soli TaxID=2590999 RepID=A0A843YWK2_9BURK|nr:YdcF family protein [Glaciimonas soli]MQR02357.1 YdcF family protein [Glaciimonas soli]
MSVFKYSFLVALLFFFLTAVAITIDGFNDQLKISDVAIVFGNKVNPDGSVSPRLAARLNKAVELYNSGIIPNLIVSGGIGKEGIDEAIAMRKYLVDRKIPSTSILVDSQGNTTADTAKNSAAMMRQHGFKSALLVSQYFHISRARLAFKQCGISTLSNAHPRFFEWRDIYSLAREVVGFYSYTLKNDQCRKP